MGWYVTAQADATLGIIGFPINEVLAKSKTGLGEMELKSAHFVYTYIDKNDDDGSDNDDDMDVVP